jgi:hypothetical protein
MALKNSGSHSELSLEQISSGNFSVTRFVTRLGTGRKRWRPILLAVPE